MPPANGEGWGGTGVAPALPRGRGCPPQGGPGPARWTGLQNTHSYSNLPRPREPARGAGRSAAVAGSRRAAPAREACGPERAGGAGPTPLSRVSCHGRRGTETSSDHSRQTRLAGLPNAGTTFASDSNYSQSQTNELCRRTKPLSCA